MIALKNTTNNNSHPDLKELATIANTLLFNGTKYQTDRNVISNIFDYTSKNFSIEAIITRLTIIDSYYSTQMSKRYFGIEEIADKLYEHCNHNETKLQEQFISLTKYPFDCSIIEVFHHPNYGIHKNGKDAGKAISLISKYAFFQTKFQFPIYDSLAFEVFPLIIKEFFNDQEKELKLKQNNISNFIATLNKLKEISGIDNYDHLDNLLWLCGKILNGSFSMIIKNRKKYIKLTKAVEKDEACNDKDFSKQILHLILQKSTDLNAIFKNDDLVKIIKFASQLYQHKNKKNDC